MTCPVNPEHGRVYDLDSGRYYCPHEAHIRDHTRSLFDPDEVLAGHELRRTTAPTKRVRRARK